MHYTTNYQRAHLEYGNSKKGRAAIVDETVSRKLNSSGSFDTLLVSGISACCCLSVVGSSYRHVYEISALPLRTVHMRLYSCVATIYVIKMCNCCVSAQAKTALGDIISLPKVSLILRSYKSMCDTVRIWRLGGHQPYIMSRQPPTAAWLPPHSHGRPFSYTTVH